MDCRDIKELVIQYSAGDLPAGDEVQVETHLAGCEECSAYLAQSRMAWKMLDEWEGIEPGGEFVSEFWRRVAQDEMERKNFFGLFNIPRPGIALAGALATVLIVGVFTFVLFEPDQESMRFTERDEQDDQILRELDMATTSETPPEALAIYGPWDNGVEIMRINGNGGMN